SACLVDSDQPAATAELDRLDLLASTQRYVQLQGRVQWLKAFIHTQRGELANGLAEYRAAREYFRAAGDADSEAAMVARQTEALQLLGEARGAWRERAGVLALMPRVRNPSHRVGVLAEATWACFDAGLPRA